MYFYLPVRVSVNSPLALVTPNWYILIMDKEARRRQSEQMKKEHKKRNLLGIAMLTGIWRGTVFINGIARGKTISIFKFNSNRRLKK